VKEAFFLERIGNASEQMKKPAEAGHLTDIAIKTWLRGQDLNRDLQVMSLTTQTSNRDPRYSGRRIQRCVKNFPRLKPRLNTISSLG
jgi:hypothetical protein